MRKWLITALVLGRSVAWASSAYIDVTLTHLEPEDQAHLLFQDQAGNFLAIHDYPGYGGAFSLHYEPPAPIPIIVHVEYSTQLGPAWGNHIPYVLDIRYSTGAGEVTTQVSGTLTYSTHNTDLWGPYPVDLLPPVDTTPPVVSLQADRTEIWPPNHKAVQIRVDGRATDEGGLASVTLTVDDEYDELDSTMELLGVLRSDGTFEVPVWLVASRSGGDRDGRTYTLTVSATDLSGNVAVPASVVVTVPHDRSKQ